MTTWTWRHVLHSSWTLLALMVGACASQASHLSADITGADRICQQHTYKTQMALVQCFDANERATVAKDLPNLLDPYDAWNTARLAAAGNYDSSIMSVRANAWTAFKVKAADSTSRFEATVAPVWTLSGPEKAALKQEADKAAWAACRKDGLYPSHSLVVAFRCERDVRIPLMERKVPALSSPLRDYWGELLAAATEYDASVLPAIQQAAIGFRQAIEPAKAEFRSEVQAALQADAAETARQREEAAELLAGLAQAALVVVGTEGALRAARDEGALQGLQRTRIQIQQTNCNRFGNTVNCFTTSN